MHRECDTRLYMADSGSHDPGIYADHQLQMADPRRFAQARALAVLASLAVNVITI